MQTSLFLLGYTRNQPIFGRATYWQALMPLGLLNADTPLPASQAHTFVHGIADPTVGGTINLFGTPAMKLADVVRHDLRLSANLGVLVTLPVGQYDETEPLNLGANRVKTRISAPVVWSLTAFVPGSR